MYRRDFCYRLSQHFTVRVLLVYRTWHTDAPRIGLCGSCRVCTDVLAPTGRPGEDAVSEAEWTSHQPAV